MKFVIAVILLVAAVPALAQETRIAAVVNDEAISVGDLAARMRLITASSNLDNSPQSQQRISRQVLRNLIDEKLEMQEAKRLGITISDAEVTTAIASIEQQNNMPKGALDQYLAARGIDRRTLVDQVSSQLAWSKVIHQSAVQATPVSDEEIDAALVQYKELLGEARARVAEIFLSVDAPNQDEEVHHFADRLYDQLRAGANFNAIAHEFSKSATSAVGGDIGWVTPSQLSSELAEVVPTLAVGQFSQPIRSTGGYYLLYIAEKRAANTASDDETTVSLDQILFPLPANAAPADRQKVITQAESATKGAKSCGEFMKIGHDVAPQSSGELGKVKVVDLPAELRAPVLALKVAEPSRPMPLRGGIGVLMVCEREAATDAMPTRDQMGDSLARDRLEALARRYLRDLRRAAFVDQRV